MNLANRFAAISTGAFVLAEAGLLDGRNATTHWTHAPLLQTLHPAVKLDRDRIFTNGGPIWTTAGGAVGLDLSLALIENDLGGQVAKGVARELVIYHGRTGSQSQISTLLELAPRPDRIRAALTYARDNLHKSLTVPDLAEAAPLSPRQFSRAFQAETGQSPAKAIETLRVEGARTLMEQSRHPIDVVARQTGFSDRDHMRRAFVRAFGHPPQVLRRMARLTQPMLRQQLEPWPKPRVLAEIDACSRSRWSRLVGQFGGRVKLGSGWGVIVVDHRVSPARRSDPVSNACR